MPSITKTWSLTPYLRPERGAADRLRTIVLHDVRSFAVVERDSFTTVKKAEEACPFFNTSLTAFWGLPRLDLIAQDIVGRPYGGIGLMDTSSTVEIRTAHPDLPLCAMAAFCTENAVRPASALISPLPDTQFWSGDNHNFLQTFKQHLPAGVTIPEIVIGMYIGMRGTLSLVYKMPVLTDNAIAGAAAITGLWYGIDEVNIESFSG